MRKNCGNNLIICLWILALLLTGYFPTAPVQAVPAKPDAATTKASVSPESLLNPDGTLDLSTGFEGALDLTGWTVTLDDDRGPLLAPETLAENSGDYLWESSWMAVPNAGLNGQVYAMAVVDRAVFVGGTFTASSDGSVAGLNYIARYNIASSGVGTWEPVSNQGLNNAVYSLAVTNENLYVGGRFTATADGSVTNLNNIARYNLGSVSPGWHALPNQGLNSDVYSLALSDANIYVGGAFTATGDLSTTNLGHIVIYNEISNTWISLSKQGLNGVVRAIALDGTVLYVGGEFSATGDSSLTNLGNIARYDLSIFSWFALSNQGVNGRVLSLATTNDHVYVGGMFTTSGDGIVTQLNYIAEYDKSGGTWSGLQHQGLDSYVYTITTVADELFIGGNFSSTGDGAITDLSYIARFDIDNVEWLTLPNGGLNGDVTALAVVGNEVFHGGGFSQTTDGALKNICSITRFNFRPETWRTMPGAGLNGNVFAMTVLASDLYVGGNFSATDDNTVTDLGNIARYDTIQGIWHALPNKGLDNDVKALEVINDTLYVGGNFSQTGDGALTSLGGIARYDTISENWSGLPNQGLNNWVETLHAVNHDLYVGGFFTATGDGTLTNLGYIAHFDTQLGTWYGLSNQGLDQYVLTIVDDYNGHLFVGGGFNATGDGSINNLGSIAQYNLNGSGWVALSNQGLNGNVYGLELYGDLYVAGAFTTSGDHSVNDLNHLARYDWFSGTWHALPRQGFKGDVNTLERVDDTLYVGGYFTDTSDGSMSDLGYVTTFDLVSFDWYATPHFGLDGHVNAIAGGGGGIFVGGSFSGTGDGSLASSDLFYYGEDSWQHLYNRGLNHEVEAIAVIGNDLYIAGRFSATGNNSITNLGGLVIYHPLTGQWERLPKGGLDSYIYALAVNGTDLYVGGAFDATGDGSLTNLGGLVRINTQTDTFYPLSHQGTDGEVYALTISAGNLYVGGKFDATGDGSLTNLGNIARYNLAGGKWHAFAHHGLNDYVYALTASGRNLYVGGEFDATGDGSLTNLGNIARYNLKAGKWHAFAHRGLDDYVYALAMNGTDLYVGGSFEETDDNVITDINCVVRYDTVGGVWQKLPNQGLYEDWDGVKSLLISDDILYIGGDFLSTWDGTINELGGIVAFNLAQNKWQVMPNEGIEYFVNALALYQGRLYIGGNFGNSNDKTLQDLGNIAQLLVGKASGSLIFLPLLIR